MPDEENKRGNRKIDKRLDSMSSYLDDLYKDNYLTRSDNKKNTNQVIEDIEDDIDSLMSKVNGQNISDISNLYLRLNGKKNPGAFDLTKEIEGLFDQNKAIMDTINVDNIRRSIQAEDYQYDLICKYMTKLEDALEVKKDNVLSSDNFTKDFINIVSTKNNKTFVDAFNKRAIILKDKYAIQDLFEDMYYKASKYGEYFLYEVPYSKAFKRLLDRKNRLAIAGVRYESAVVFESSEIDKDNSDFSPDYIKELSDGKMNVNIIFDDTGIIPEPIELCSETARVKNSHKSLTESFYSNESNDVYSEAELKFEDNGLSNDGLVTKKDIEDSKDLKKDITGTVLYEIPRENIIPVYMHRMVIGYLYIQVANDFVNEIVMNGNTYNSLTNNTKLLADDLDKQNDLLVSTIAATMSQQIDSKFINANLDLKEQIFSVLRYNDQFNCTHGTNNITVSFLPAEDVHHFYFRLNEKTHRGISDLDKAVVPAMIYCMLYLNNAIGLIGRAQDKRVYYVKQNVETNVARTMLNVINQIKKGNMGMRALENMNTIFNVIGKYNDHVIPMSQSGDSPIDMQVLQGQQIETPTELMDRMEDAAVSSTDVPLEFIQSVNGVDFASRFTMSNSKFLRKVFKRQRICQNHFTEIFRKIYNFEYNENDTTVKILLPAPAYLTMNNTQQLIDNTKNYVQAITDLISAKDSSDPNIDSIKAEFTDAYIRNCLGTYLDFAQIDELYEEAKLRVAVNTEVDTSIEDNEY